MIKTEERIQSLKKFKSTTVLSFNYKKKKYNLYFEPYLNLFRAILVDDLEELPEIALSLSLIINSRHESFNRLSKFDDSEMMIEKIYKRWKQMSAEKKDNFLDLLPLNSLYLMGDSIY